MRIDILTACYDARCTFREDDRVRRLIEFVARIESRSIELFGVFRIVFPDSKDISPPDGWQELNKGQRPRLPSGLIKSSPTSMTWDRSEMGAPKVKTKGWTVESVRSRWPIRDCPMDCGSR